jgi:PAS domain S-box-containing protein
VTGQSIGAELEERVNKIKKDLHARIQSDETLNQSERQYRDVLSGIEDGYYEVDIAGNLTFFNDSLCKIYGYTRDELMGMNNREYMSPETVKKTYEIFNRVYKTGESTKIFDWEFIKKDGTKIDVEISVSRIKSSEEEAIGFRGIVRDIGERKRIEAELQKAHSELERRVEERTGDLIKINKRLEQEIAERKQIEAALRESEKKFRTFVEITPLGISLIGENGFYKYINPQFTRIFGYTIEDIPTGTDWFNKAFPNNDYRQKVIETWIEDRKQIIVGQARPRIFSVTCKDRSRKEIHFRPVTMENLDQFVICEDITEKSKLESQLQQVQKFEAIGTLAGGVAHDFNNLLMGIQGRTSLLSLDLEPAHPHCEHIQAIEEYIRSATGLTKQLLGFARGGKYEVKPVDMNELVLGTSAMFGRTKKEIRIHAKCQQESLVVEADRGQIEQVFLNMYVNAWQAMPPDGGELYLETKVVTIDNAHCKPLQAKPGRYVKVSITDTGSGMDEATRLQIFDPFFTTKEKGRGTGLGMASAYGIIKNHGGMITVYSEIGLGTTFNIYLPVSDRGVLRKIPREAGLIKGSETILLVDDEEMVIDVCQALLERLGYRVIVSRGGQDAVKVITDMGNEIDMVILDLIMPGMDGGTTFDSIREIYPGMPVLLSSGYAINGHADKIMRRGCNGFIQKPYNISELSQKVRKAG